MAFGDPANAGANHANGNTGAGPSLTITPSYATTPGNTHVIEIRISSAAVLSTIQVSEDGGSNFSDATVYGSLHTTATGGKQILYYFPNIVGVASGQTVIKITTTASTTIRANVVEYTGAFAANGAEAFTDNGSVNAFSSGNMTTSVTSTLIGTVLGGNNGVAGESPIIPGTTNSLTWTTRDELISGSKTLTAIFDFNGGGQAGGTYAMLGTWSGGNLENSGVAIYSFVPAPPPAVPTKDRLIHMRKRWR